MDWKDNLIEDEDRLREVLQTSKRVAVLGIKTEASEGQPAFDVPRFLQHEGFEIVPVPVYYPEATEILGQKVYRSLAQVPQPVDIVEVFRKSADVPAHLDDLLAARPKVVWMQLGIESPQVAETLARAGIKVVQNRCMKVESKRLL